jgi:hypothetical protein
MKKELESWSCPGSNNQKKELKGSNQNLKGSLICRLQNTNSSYADFKSLVYFGILSLLFMPYLAGQSIFENSVAFVRPVFAASDPLTDRSPSFLDAYWTDNSEFTSSSSTSGGDNNSVKEEVGPGEGASTLAVVLVNKGRSEITALTGYFALPSSGFRAIEGENLANSSGISVASHDSIVKPGEAFTLHFPIVILDEARVGAYSGTLKLVYSKVLEVGEISSSIEVPFRVTGKIILDAVSSTQNLVAGAPNRLTILINNEGSADAYGIIATVTGVTDGTATTEASDNASNIATNRDESTTNGSNSDNNSTVSTFTGTEETTVDERQEVDSEASTISLQATAFDVGNIPAGGSAYLTPTVYPSYSAGGTIQNLNLELSYNNAYGAKTTTEKSIGIVISPNPPESVLSISPVNSNTTMNLGNVEDVDNEERDRDGSILLKAGKIEEITFSVSNNGDIPLKDVVLSLDSSSDSVKILGDSRWAFSSMNASAREELSTRVFAAEDVISTPIEFTVNAEYISGGQSKTDSLNIGAYVDGEIRIKAYDFSINDVGGTPNLVGNLLNQGNTIALFTTVEMIDTRLLNASSSSTPVKQLPSRLVNEFPPQQYLGDLSENSPLPFSIPLEINKDAQKGVYPVSVKVTYSDTLRDTHELVLNGTVNYTPKSTNSSTESSGLLGFGELSSTVLALVIILAVISIIVLIVKRRQARKQRTSGNHGEELELFDDKISSADNNKVGGVRQ